MDIAIPTFLQSFLQERLSFFLVARCANDARWSGQFLVVSWQAFGHNVVRWRHEIADDAMDNQIFIDGERQGLAKLDVIQRLGQIIQAQVPDCQGWYILEAGLAFGCFFLGGWERGKIVLTSQEGLIIAVAVACNKVLNFLEFGPTTFVVGIRHEVETRRMSIAQYLERAIATALL